MASITPTSMPVQHLLGGPSPENRAGEASPRTVTSHSLRLNTRLFSFDYTWSQEELPAEPASAGVSYKPAARSAVGPYSPPQSFSEVLKRHQLASLLEPPPVRPAEYTPLVTESPAAPAQPGVAARAYDACAAGAYLPGGCRLV